MSNMRAATYSAIGSADEVLQVDYLPIPEPGPTPRAGADGVLGNQSHGCEDPRRSDPA
jgi:hypothetical protein